MTINRKRTSTLKLNQEINYKDIDLLRKFISRQGKILPRRLTGLNSKQQKNISRAVKHARILSLLPFVNKDT
uniref:Ribosomal protein S18 n=1 Tax=Bangiopsis subsimplex TaxID=139980 RepID=A0A1C9CCR9_9RHOD|nr:ribosomal protein S18 [Bangiopsis subsimplex]AOM66191.1 ribosomal protein S18 [Bangiopsis subsimplex]ARO90448.1 30S ribosomal protein S18 [Bangiopsis subsimplex]